MNDDYAPWCRWCLLSQSDTWIAAHNVRRRVCEMPDDYRTHLVRWLVRHADTLLAAHFAHGGTLLPLPDNVADPLAYVQRSPLVQALVEPARATAHRS